MTSKRVYYAIIGLILLLTIGIIGGTYGVNNLLQSRSNKVVLLKSKLAGLQQQQTELTQAKKAITAYTSLDHIAKVVVPENKDQAEAVRQIVALASANGIQLDSITFPSSTLGATPVGVKPVASAAPAATPSASSQALSQLVPVPNIPGVYDLVINIDSATETGHLATYSEMINFLSALEQNRLTALVSSISILPDATNHSLFSFILTLDIYIKP